MKVKLWHWWVVVALNGGTVIYTAVTGEIVAVIVFLLLTIAYAWLAGFALGDGTFQRGINTELEKL